MDSGDLASALFGTWFHATDQAVFAVDLDGGRIVCANPRFTELLGAGTVGLLGTALAAWVAEPSEAAALLAAEPRYREHLAFRRVDGAMIHVSFSLSRVVLAERALLACVGRDTSTYRAQERERVARHSELHAAHGDLTQLVSELSEAKLELEDRNHEIAVLAGQVSRFGWRAAVGELVAGIAHHLNNPVGALASTLRRLEHKVQDVSEPALRETLTQLVTRSREIGQRIETNVNAVVRTHAAGAADTSRQSLTLPHEIETALSMFADRLQQVLIIRDYQDHPSVFAPHDSLHLVLSNLLDNSLRAMRDVGTLTLTIRHREGRVVLRIADSGDGVPAEVVPHLFEPILWARSGGAGLGLSTAQRLARAWGGTIAHVASTSGAVFEIGIPTQAMDRADPASPARGSVSPVPAPGRGRAPAPARAANPPSDRVPASAPLPSSLCGTQENAHEKRPHPRRR